MNLEFKEITSEDIEIMLPYYEMRKNRTCDSVFLESFIWKEFYKVRYAIWEEKAILWLMEYNGNCFSAMPMCREEDLPGAFGAIEQYFNEVLGRPLVMNLADEYAVQYLNLPEDKYFVKEQEDSRDYLYLGESLRKLSGKKLHKKKNRLNVFLRQYEGRFEYRSMCCSDKEDVWKFLDRWRLQKGENVEEHLDYEVRGIHDILRNCSDLHIRMGGIYIDDKLEAFSVGSYNPVENMAVIHIEKADPEISGLYQAINQQFLLHEFPDVEWVNREDDLGIEGLRKAKMSYNPADFARKYLVEQLVDGKRTCGWTDNIENIETKSETEYLSPEEKRETMPLWQSCFPEDSLRYLDNYYTEKGRDNQILVKKEEGKICSMLHRNPYQMKFGSRLCEADYIVAVATQKEYRGKGYMREVLIRALQDMHREKRPFTFLMPAAEVIYTPFDFTYIWKNRKAVLTSEGEGHFQKTLVQRESEDCKKTAEIMTEWLDKRYQVHTVRDERYVLRLLKELESEEGALYFLYENGNAVGLQGIAGGEKKEERLVYADEKWCDFGEEKPVIMGRITHAEEFLSLFTGRGKEEIRLILEIRDDLIPDNSGKFLWELTDRESSLISVGESLPEVPVLKADIVQLAQWLFGYKEIEEIWDNLEEPLENIMRNIQIAENICLDEIV